MTINDLITVTLDSYYPLVIRTDDSKERYEFAAHKWFTVPDELRSQKVETITNLYDEVIVIFRKGKQ